MRQLSHADIELHGRRRTAPSQHPGATARPIGIAGHAERLHPMPYGPVCRVGRRDRSRLVSRHDVQQDKLAEVADPVIHHRSDRPASYEQVAAKEILSLSGEHGNGKRNAEAADPQSGKASALAWAPIRTAPKAKAATTAC